MSSEWLLIDRQAAQAELQKVFDTQTTTVLLGVLERVAAQIYAAGVTREDFSELKQIVAELAQGQRELRQSVAALAAAQARSEERLTRLEDAVARLETAVERLAAAQAQTQYALQDLAKQVGGLSDTIGGDIEDIAYFVVHRVLRDAYGWQVGPLKRTWQTWDGQPEEVNIFGQVLDPARPDRVIWIVGEAKHNLTLKEVERFIRQVKRARQHLTGEIFAVCFCYRARPEVQDAVKAAGLRLVFSYGELI